jgi:hypothetical protein
MTIYLCIGSALGASLGLLHGSHLFRRQSRWALASGVRAVRAMGLYYALWTFALWTLLGSYVLGLSIIGAIAYSGARLVPRRKTP